MKLRLSAAFNSSPFFFKPLYIHLQTANLLVQRIRDLFNVQGGLALEKLSGPFQQGLLPAANLHGGDPVLRGELRQRPILATGSQGNFGLQF